MAVQKAEDLKAPSDSDSSIYVSMTQASKKDAIKEQKTLKSYSKDITYSLYKENGKSPVSVFSSRILPVMFPVNYMDMDYTRKDLISNSLNQKEALFASVSEDTGDWLYMAMPVTLNNTGNTVIEIGMSIEDYTERYETLKRLFSYIVLGIALIVFVIILATIISTMASIRKLSSGVEKIAGGHFDVRVNVNTGDEIEHLARKFNDMASYIESYTRKLAELNKSYYRFIPEKFISMLGVESIEKVSIRDHVKEDMAVMHFNVRSFFEIAGNMKSEDIFKFINGVFERFTPIVQDFGGIIDRFMDTGFTAVFPESPESAVNAALRIQEKLAAWNMERSKENSTKVNIGVVLHYGTVMLGVIGDGTRLSSAAVSQCLHIATSLEEYGNKSNISVLATDEIVRNIPSGVFKKRYIGGVSYNNTGIDIYDFFEGDEFSIRERKETSMENFNNGVIQFKKGDYYKARALFIDVMRILPEDGAARRYLFLSDEYYHNKETGKGYYTI
jgi:Adenylate cyclase, family 3 (some proteins contain HAMP domain)